ncbi:hypothetical protein H310_14620, partial [Aphanomyces invadans]
SALAQTRISLRTTTLQTTMQRSLTSAMRARRLEPSRRSFSDSTRRRQDVSRLWTVGSFPKNDDVADSPKSPIYDTWGMLSSLPTNQVYGYTSALHIIGTLPKTNPRPTSTAATSPSTFSEQRTKSIVMP